VRIIAGSLKGRRLAAPDWEGLRPTSDKLRETLFNVLAPHIAGARFLDAYAGSGAVGLEALSRGAAHVTFLDQDRRAIELIRRNLEQCGCKDGYAIIRVDVATLTALDTQPFDIIFLDPPYGAAEMASALAAAARLTAAGTRVVLEHAKRDTPPAVAGALTLTRELSSGDSGLAFYRNVC
jgi:16S rRNA (guanine966-N2)-methyltransferase